MKITINNEKTLNKTLEYEESFWTSKRVITYDGINLKKLKYGLYEYRDGDIVECFKIEGNQILGIKINMFNNDIVLERSLTWYEIVLSLLVFVPCILFGLVGGIVGGLLGAANLILIRQLEKWYLKVIVSILLLAIGMLLSFIFAVHIFKIIFSFM